MRLFDLALADAGRVAASIRDRVGLSEPALRRSTIARMSRNSSPIEATVIVNGPVRTRVPHPTSSSAASGRPEALFSGTKKPLIVTHSPVTTRLEMTNMMMASAG